jgi:hypothetical protein
VNPAARLAHSGTRRSSHERLGAGQHGGEGQAGQQAEGRVAAEPLPVGRGAREPAQEAGQLPLGLSSMAPESDSQPSAFTIRSRGSASSAAAASVSTVIHFVPRLPLRNSVRRKACRSGMCLPSRAASGSSSRNW